MSDGTSYLLLQVFNLTTCYKAYKAAGEPGWPSVDCFLIDNQAYVFEEFVLFLWPFSNPYLQHYLIITVLVKVPRGVMTFTAADPSAMAGGITTVIEVVVLLVT